MKTVAVGRGNTFRIFFVLAALGAFYFYRRQGGSVGALVSRGSDLLRQGRGMLGGDSANMGSQSVATSAQI